MVPLVNRAPTKIYVGMGYAWDMGYSEAMNEHETKPDNNYSSSEKPASK